MKFVASALLISATMPADANDRRQLDNQNSSCTYFEISGGNIPFVVIVNPAHGGKLHYMANGSADTDKCPSRDPICQLPTYLVRDDKVVISARTDELACVHSFSKNGNIVSGWVSIADLKFKGESDATLSGSTGLGEWRNPWASISIRRAEDDFVIIEGEASVGPPNNLRTGNISGPAFLSENDRVAGYDEAQYRGNEPANAAGKSGTACRIRLKILGYGYLAVDDNDNCGGQGVSFTGLYRKLK